MRVLVVDDTPDNIRVLSQMLSEDGHRISVATNGRQALEVAAASQPDLILLDVLMPGMDGYQVCAALKLDPRLAAIPVIFVTALADTEDEQRGLDLGAVDYIAKPFKDAIVRRRVRTHLELKRQRDLLEQLALVDSLTGIPNRRAFDKRLDREWRRALRSHTSLAAAIVDVDHFKRYNDTRGHPAGDEALRRVAGALSESARRAGDFVARCGGEEFVCLFGGLDAEGLKVTSEQQRAAVEALRIPHGASSASEWITVSIGATLCWPTPELVPYTLLEQADWRLYAAKQQGRNRVRVGLIEASVCQP